MVTGSTRFYLGEKCLQIMAKSSYLRINPIYFGSRRGNIQDILYFPFDISVQNYAFNIEIDGYQTMQ